MIDEKMIVHAASDYADKRCEEDEELSFNQLLDAFEDGANWFKENLWHDASEEPEIDKALLVQHPKKGKINLHFLVWAKEDNMPWCEKAAGFNITRWLYIEDLMKGGK